MPYELKLSDKERSGSRLIAQVRKLLTVAALEQKYDGGISQQYIATQLGVNRSVINRLLRGTTNLTLRTVGELAWALGLEAVFVLRKRQHASRRNSEGIKIVPQEFRTQPCSDQQQHTFKHSTEQRTVSNGSIDFTANRLQQPVRMI